MKIYTKESLVAELLEIQERGWIRSVRPANAGGIGNTLETLLGIEENNLPIPNAAEWELKCQRSKTSSLLTLMHMEPSPTALRFVPSIFLPKYGWPHREAGLRYGKNEMSFRQTINGKERSDRGFKVVVDRETRRVLISFDPQAVDPRHKDWLQSVASRVPLGELNPQPYWGFDDLYAKARTKLHNCFYVLADTKRIDGIEHFKYSKIMMLRNFQLEQLLSGIDLGYVYVDFDARTGHNHGTKFRIRQDKIPLMYAHVLEIKPGISPQQLELPPVVTPLLDDSADS
jgi:hypothetical protein